MFQKFKDKKIFFMLITVIIGILTCFVVKNSKSKNGSIKIGIIQFVEHEALDKSREGFIGRLETEIKSQNLNWEITYKNAQGDQSNCTMIANQFISEKYDLILAIATTAAQSVSKATQEIPIIVTAITNPEDAGLVKSNSKPDTNITGVSDLAPISKQIALIKQLKPSAQKVGILCSSNEANSKYQAEIARQECEKLGFKSRLFNFSQMNEIQFVVESMLEKVDAIYTPTDNAVASNMELIAKIALSAGIPVICGEDNLLSKGATVTFGVDYFELGKLSAEQAIKILKNGEKPQNMPIEYAKEPKLALNHDVLEQLGLKIPQNLD